MATLTETAFYTRRAINWGIIALVLFFILKFFLGLAMDTWKKIFPPPPPPPTLAFGKLPAIKFPAPSGQAASLPEKLDYTLETIEGKPSIASATATVFFMPKPSANLLSLTRASQLATKMGFKNEPQSESASVYLWRDDINPFRALRIDIVTGNFKISYDYASDLAVFAQKDLPAKDQAIAEAINFLNNLGLYSLALANGSPKASYWQLSGNSLITTTSMSGADAVRIDFEREDILGLKILPSYPPYEPVYFLFSGSLDPSKRILEASYKFWQIDTDQWATYPLKTASVAWEELKSGKGYIARIGENPSKIIVRKIYLAYFYPEDYQEFLQPIFVFEGDPKFLGYVTAISPDWAGK